MRRGALLLALGLASCLRGESHEVELGVENFFYQTRPSLLNLGNVLGLKDQEDLLRATFHGKEVWGEARVVVSGYVETQLGGGSTPTWTAREAYAQYSFGPGVSVRVGKQRVDWGSGLAWNPTNRIEPPKNPLDTALEEQGALAARVDMVPAPWVGVTFLAAHSNTRPGDLPFPVPGPTATIGALRARFLVKDTDLALVLSGGTYTHRVVGVDVARNLGPFAVHFEGAVTQGSDLLPPRSDTFFPRLVAGFLETEGTTSYSLEYFYNGDGWTHAAYSAYRESLPLTFAQSVDPTLPAPARQAASEEYLTLAGIPYAGGMGLRRHYLHASWSRGELMGRFGLQAQAVWGLSDSGLVLTPGVSYEAKDQMTFDLDAVLLLGASTSEYRLGPIRSALAARVRFFF
jgi:hypothetical protein